MVSQKASKGTHVIKTAKRRWNEHIKELFIIQQKIRNWWDKWGSNYRFCAFRWLQLSILFIQFFFFDQNCCHLLVYMHYKLFILHSSVCSANTRASYFFLICVNEFLIVVYRSLSFLHLYCMQHAFFKCLQFVL